MFKTKASLPLFLLACVLHAAGFIYFFTVTISEALDGSHRESFLDSVPLILFLLTFTIHLLPALRKLWAEAPVKLFLIICATTAGIVFAYAKLIV